MIWPYQTEPLFGLAMISLAFLLSESKNVEFVLLVPSPTLILNTTAALLSSGEDKERKRNPTKSEWRTRIEMTGSEMHHYSSTSPLETCVSDFHSPPTLANDSTIAGCSPCSRPRSVGCDMIVLWWCQSGQLEIVGVNMVKKHVCRSSFKCQCGTSNG